MYLSIVFTINLMVLAPLALAFNYPSYGGSPYYGISDTSYSPSNPLYNGPSSYPSGYNSYYKAPVYSDYSGYDTGYGDYNTNSRTNYYVAIAKAGNTPTPSYVQPSIYSGTGYTGYSVRKPYYPEPVTTTTEEPSKDETTEESKDSDYNCEGKRGKCCKNKCKHRHRCHHRRCHDKHDHHDD